ncbi:hypothetical protein, unlikely [Trypanosoma congolense IL3000]|uniref:Uncharacterized protein n=1 Tax=Trypanosoma congolense (strain IL3000) TaxID=1068625 RepID=F9WBF7_TRYCI|nr:hypothetical protein, unlikely [Trypanosoma congolense IL3000]
MSSGMCSAVAKGSTIDAKTDSASIVNNPNRYSSIDCTCSSFCRKRKFRIYFINISFPVFLSWDKNDLFSKYSSVRRHSCLQSATAIPMSVEAAKRKRVRLSIPVKAMISWPTMSTMEMMPSITHEFLSDVQSDSLILLVFSQPIS